MSLSRFIAWLSFAATLATAAAAVLQFIKPSWAVYAVAFTGAVNAFTERVQGGKSKLEDQLDNGTLYPPKES